MKIKKSFEIVLYLVLLLLSLTACSRAQDVPLKADPLVEVESLDADINLAIGKQLNFLAPGHFHKAQEYLKEARINLEKKLNTFALHSVMQSRTQLNQSNIVGEIAKNDFDEVLLARREAILAGARNYVAKDFIETDKKFGEVTAGLEENKPINLLENKNFFKALYQDLELRSIKIASLRQSLALIEQAQDEGAEEFSPRYLAITKKSIVDAENFISANRHDRTQIEFHSKKTLEQAQHLLRSTRHYKTNDYQRPTEYADSR